MSKFGWSLAPGVRRLPDEEPCGCDVCGKYVEDCECGMTSEEKRIADLERENAKLRASESRNKNHIHELRKRIESLTQEMEKLRTKLAVAYQDLGVVDDQF